MLNVLQSVKNKEKSVIVRVHKQSVFRTIALAYNNSQMLAYNNDAIYVTYITEVAIERQKFQTAVLTKNITMQKKHQ